MAPREVCKTWGGEETPVTCGKRGGQGGRWVNASSLPSSKFVSVPAKEEETIRSLAEDGYGEEVDMEWVEGLMREPREKVGMGLGE